MRINVLTSLRFLAYLLIYFSATEAVASQAYSIKWKMGKHEGTAPVSVGTAASEGRKLLYLFLRSPIADLKRAERIDEDGEIRPVSVMKRGKYNYLLLSNRKAKLTLTKFNGQSVPFEYEMLPGLSTLKITSNCDSLNLIQKKIPVVSTGFPAAITCQIDPGGNSLLVFSSLEEAEWFGSEVFEVAGKGERYKVFALKDISILSAWNIFWGAESSRSTATLHVKAVAKSNDKSPKSSLKLKVGFSYLSGTIMKDIATGSIEGVQIPVGIDYHKDRSWWFLGASYNFFLYSISSGKDGKTNTTSDYSLWSGLDYRKGSVRWRGLIGYINRSLILDGNSSTFEAPMMGMELGVDQGKRSWGLFGKMSQAVIGGRYSEINAGLYYQEKWFFQNNQRLQLSTTRIEASSEISNLESDWLTITMGFEF